MKLQVLGSSSAGNCYLLRADNGEVLIIEAGIKLADVKKALNFDLSRIAGCLITHEHGDHAKWQTWFRKACIPVYGSRGTFVALGLGATSAFATSLQTLQAVHIGSFTIMPFPVQHDAQEPVGYLIRHPECGTVVFATDTYYLRYRFADVANWLIECNYRHDILDRNYNEGRIDASRRDRTIKSHMSLETCLEILRTNNLSKTNNIVLLHLSADNSNAEQFVRSIAKATGKHVVAASPGLTIDFNQTPY